MPSPARMPGLFLGALCLLAAPRVNAQATRRLTIDDISEEVTTLASQGLDIGAIAARAGDIDGDGRDDVLLSAGASAVEKVILLYGLESFLRDIDPLDPAVRTTVMEIGHHWNGQALLSGGGDWNGDGLDDFVVATPHQTAVVFGSSSLPRAFALEDLGSTVPGVLLPALVYRPGESPPAARIGPDVNGDGVPELFLGDPNWDVERGRAMVIFGGPSLPPLVDDLDDVGRRLPGLVLYGLEQKPAGDRIGTWAAGIGDIDGDGFGDIGVGGDACQKGSFIVFGEKSLLGALEMDSVPGARGTLFERLGGPMEPAGDWNGDGRNDFTLARGGPGGIPGSQPRVLIVGGRPRAGFKPVMRIDELVRDPLTLSLTEESADCPGSTMLSAGAGAGADPRLLLSGRALPGDMEPDLADRGCVLLLSLAGASGGAAPIQDAASRSGILIQGRHRDQLGTGYEAPSVLKGFRAGGESLLIAAGGNTIPGRVYVAPIESLTGPRAIRLEEVSPGVGHVRGGDVVRVSGQGLSQDVQLFFDGKAAETIAVEGSSAVLIRTPPRTVGPGTAAITAVTGTRSALLPAAFQYFDSTLIDVDDIRTGARAGGVLRSTRVALDAGTGLTRVPQILGLEMVFDVTADGVDDVLVWWDAGSEPGDPRGAAAPHRTTSSIVQGGARLKGIVDYSAGPGAIVLPFDAATEDPDEPVLSRLCGSGDVDGDGTGDLAVVASNAASGSESLYVLHGSSALPAMARVRDFPRRTRISGLTLERPGEALLRIVPDLDGGGLADIVLSEGPSTPSGLLHVLRGEDLRGKDGLEWRSLEKRSFTLRLPYLLDACSLDWNGDGLTDLALGAASDWRESIVMLLGGGSFQGDGETVVDDGFLDGGKRGAVIAGRPGVSWRSLGSSLASAGDVDGDGRADLIAGEPSVDVLEGRTWSKDVGEAYVISANSLEGPPLDPPFGLEWQRDVGLTPSFVLDPASPRPGILALQSPYDQEQVGLAVSGAGDLNGDGLPDLAVGSAWTLPGESFNPPSRASGLAIAYVLFGGPSLLERGSVRLARERFDAGLLLRGAGNSLTGGRDVDGDGLSDLVAARKGASAYVIPGASLSGGMSFIRGDADSSSSLNLTDALAIVGHLFLGAPAPGCLDAADVDDSGEVDLSDAVRLLGHLFRGGPAPEPPFPEAGHDTTPGGPGCVRTP